MTTPRIGSAAALLLLVSIARPQAQTPVTVVNVWAAETQQFSHFGSDLQLAGDLLISGAERQKYAGTGGGSVGSVYVFRQTGAGPYAGYAEEAALRPAPVARTAPGIFPATGYGFSVETCVVPGGDTFVVGGAPDEPVPNPANPNRNWIFAGAAYVHRRDAATGAWALDGRLAVPNPSDYAYGGTAVAIACTPPAVPGEPPTVEAVVWVDTRFVVWHRDAAGAWSIRQTLDGGVYPLPVSGVTDVFVASAPGPAAHPALLALGGAQRTRVWRRTGTGATPWTAEATLASPLTGQDEYYGRGSTSTATSCGRDRVRPADGALRRGPGARVPLHRVGAVRRVGRGGGADAGRAALPLRERGRRVGRPGRRRHRRAWRSARRAA